MDTLQQTAAPHGKIADENNFVGEYTIRRDKSIVAVLGNLQPDTGQSGHTPHGNCGKPSDNGTRNFTTRRRFEKRHN